MPGAAVELVNLPEEFLYEFGELPDQIDCDGGGDMLQACLRDPDIAASPQSAATDRLFMCSLNACACGVALFEIFRRLMLSGGLQRLMMLTGLVCRRGNRAC